MSYSWCKMEEECFVEARVYNAGGSSHAVNRKQTEVSECEVWKRSGNQKTECRKASELAKAVVS